MELRSYGVTHLSVEGAGGMPRKKEEKESTKASIYVDPEEYTDLGVEAKKEDTKITRFLLRRIRVGGFVETLFGKYLTFSFLKTVLGDFVLGEYDWKDMNTIYEGGEPDRDWIKKDIQSLRKDISLSEYQKRLLLRKKQVETAKKETARMCDLNLDILNEELDEVEHLLEKLEK
jgi:hypothetical protein